ncbi:MAG TPA: ATP-binding protein [Pilimelia sp.]|nr:ATP-binding protein [Pilimelia sp.]
METDRRALYETTFDASTLRSARREVDRHVFGSGLADDRAFDFVAAVIEILSNAVRHGGGGGTVTVSRDDGHVWCVITDRGPGLPAGEWTPPPAPPPADAESGRGLWLANALCSYLVVRSSAAGTRVELGMTVE